MLAHGPTIDITSTSLNRVLGPWAPGRLAQQLNLPFFSLQKEDSVLVNAPLSSVSNRVGRAGLD
jgi:hypothetical protein